MPASIEGQRSYRERTDVFPLKKLVSRDQRLLITVILAVAFGGLISRIPFRISYLGWDEIQFLLGTHDFNIIKHQPHPPGYILFVGILRIVHALVGDEILSVVVTATLFSSASALLLFLFARALFNDARAAVLAALFWLASPLVWFSDLNGQIYSAGALTSLATAYFVFRFWKNPGERSAILAAGVFAVSAGIRQDQAAFLAPLWLFPFIRSRACRRFFPLALSVFVLGYLAWYIPTVELSGGYRAYSRLVREQFLQSAKGRSIFFGAPIALHAWLLWTLFCAIFLGLLPVLLLMAFRWPRRTGQETQSLISREDAMFLGLWAAPFLLFFGLVHMARLEYCLACLPPLFLVTVRWASRRYPSSPHGLSRLARLSLLSVLVTCLFFFGARDLPLLPRSHSDHGFWKASWLLPRVLDESVLEPVYDRVRYANETTSAYFNEIRHAASGQPIALILIATTSPGLCCLDWRKLMYYFPQVPVFTIEVNELAGKRPRTLAVGVGFERTDGSALLRFKSLGPDRNLALMSVSGRARILIVAPATIAEEVLVESEPVATKELIPQSADRRYLVCTLFEYDSRPDSHLRLRFGENDIMLVP